MCNNCAVYHRGWGKKLIHTLISDNSTWIVEYNESADVYSWCYVQMGPRRKWMGRIATGGSVCAWRAPIKTCSQLRRERICGESLSICLSICLSFVPRFGTDLAGRSTYVYIYVNPIRGFPFRLGICTTLNISHTHAEIDIGHLPDSIFRPRSGKDVDWRSPKDTEDIILKFERWWRVDELDAILPCPW